jgi:hypothetical protein
LLKSGQELISDTQKLLEREAAEEDFKLTNEVAKETLSKYFWIQ